MIVTDEMIDKGTGYATGQEIFNYLIVGSIAYLSWSRGIRLLKEPNIDKRENL
jgi:hypothetical protein